MNARLSLNSKFSKNQLKQMTEFVNDKLRNEQATYTRRILKIACIALNDTAGFGKQRLVDFLNKVTTLSDEHINDEIFWTHADARVIDQIGIPFQREDYERIEKL